MKETKQFVVIVYKYNLTLGNPDIIIWKRDDKNSDTFNKYKVVRGNSNHSYSEYFTERELDAISPRYVVSFTDTLEQAMEIASLEVL